MKTNYREDFLRLLAGERPGGVVWTADLSYWVSGRQADGTADPAWQTERGTLELHRSLGVMPYYYYERFWTGRAVYDAMVHERMETAGPVTVHLWETPVGTLREESRYLPESACHGVTRHPVRTAADLDILLSLLEHRRLEPDNLGDYGQRRELWAGYDGLPCLGLPRSPLSALAYEWAGIEALTFLLLDEPDRVGQALALLEAQEMPVLEAVCKAAPPLVHFPDNLSSDNLTGFYDEYLAPTHRRRLAKLHAAGVKAAVHLDGTVVGLLPKLVASGFDAVEALTPRPAGDVDTAAMRALAGSDRTILWGGVPGVMFAPPYTWADMRRHVERVLELWKGQPFVLGVADQVPPDGDIEFVKRIAEMVQHG
jgi:uroporphyrinogen-III decarboxylase